MHPTIFLVVGVLLASARAAHHNRGGSSRWDHDAGVGDDVTSRTRHPLRHHGQDAPVGVSSLDVLINRLDTLNGLESTRSSAASSHGNYWGRHKGEDRENQLAQEELRKVVEEYERGDVLPDANARNAPTTATPRKQHAQHAHRGTAASRAPEPKRKPHLEDEDDLDEDLDSDADEDDKDDDEDGDDFDEDADEDDESEEVDKSAEAPRDNPQLAEMLDVDYKDSAQTLSDAPPSYSYSEQKWNAYSTPERLAQTRRHGPSPQAQTAARMAKLARDHMIRMMVTDGTCKVPKPVVVNVKQQYPDPSKEYVPHCTILHRCTDSTGCCRSSEETCKPKATATHKVELAFYTTRVGYKESIVEMLTFYNETECECQRIQEDSRFHHRGSSDLRAQSSPASSSSALDSYYSSRKQRQARTQLDMPPSYIQLAPYTKPGCRCPSTYSPREMPQPRGCACDCFDRQTDCLRFKRGKEYFSIEDRLCIQTSQCKLPECEFGTYMKLSGRCPKKNEKFMRYNHSNSRDSRRP